MSQAAQVGGQCDGSSPSTTRIAAIVLPQLACELVRQRLPGSVGGLLAVIFEPGSAGAARGETRVEATATLDVVSDEARRYGVRPGQKVTEASALVSGLAIHRVTYGEVEAALGRVAEVAMALGTTAAIRLEERRTEGKGDALFYDTVWLDITGAAHLVGGEEALALELSERVAALGHRVRVAIAQGPRLAQALARHGGGAGACVVVAEGEGPAALAPLPVHALPIDADTVSFFVRVGILTVADLAALPRASAAARLGARAAVALDLAQGRDSTPLVPFTPPRTLEESAIFEEPVESSEALLFVLRGMTSRVAARLGARGEACSRLEVTAVYDRSIALLRLAERERASDIPALALELAVDLPAPLTEPGDLLRALKAKIERAELLAPAVALRLCVPQIARARRVQLDLSRNRAVSPDALPALLAELSAEIGVERVGVLEVTDAHRPEARTRLVPLGHSAVCSNRGEAKRRDPGYGGPRTPHLTEPAGGKGREPFPGTDAPTRLLPTPVPIGRVARGAVALVDKQLYAIEKVRFVMRLEGVEWWTDTPASRDYARAWLVSGESAAEGWIYVDRASGEGFLQGWCE